MDMRNRASAMFRDKDIGVCSNPAAQLALDDFMASILVCCGIDSNQTELEVLEKIKEVAANHIVAQKPDEEKPILD